MTPTSAWFLTSRERGNPATSLDSRHPDGVAWTEGNLVRPLIHGATYFAELHHRVSQMRAGDLLMFTDWRGDPDRPELDVAYLGGSDLCHGRRDDASHQGDPQPQPMAAA